MSEERTPSRAAAEGPPFALYVEGEVYKGWQSMRVTRRLEAATSDFELSVSERWNLEDDAWQIAPGNKCEIRFEDETVLTGYVDAYRPSYDATSHNVRLSGRSKTCDFVDSSVLVDGGQFTGMTVGAIAKELAKPFGIEVVLEADGDAEGEVQVNQSETCFGLVERLCRLQELLITDDAQGRLVICRAGSSQCSSALKHGVNIKSASANLDDSKRFSHYYVKAQRPGNGLKANDNGEADWLSDWQSSAQFRMIPNVSERYALRMAEFRARERAGAGSSKKRKAPRTLTQVGATVLDKGIARYRPHVIIAETQANDKDAQKRAEWEMRRRLAQALRATITINGWRQQDGRLWATNEMVDVLAPWLALDRELIIAQVQFSYGTEGEVTELELTLPDAFLPDAKRKAKKKAKKKGKGKKKGGGPALWVQDWIS